jgi:uncharacterized protein YkuJ
MAYEQNGRGEIANLILHAHLIKEGYQVLKEDGSQGTIDLVGVHLETGEVRFFDVKCISRRKDGTKVNRTLSDRQRQLEINGNIFIELAYVDTETYEVQIPKRRKTWAYEKDQEVA